MSSESRRVTERAPRRVQCGMAVIAVPSDVVVERGEEERGGAADADADANAGAANDGATAALRWRPAPAGPPRFGSYASW